MYKNNFSKYHAQIISQNKYNNLRESIISDIFMNRIKIIDNKLFVNINNIVSNLIEEWYELANLIKQYNENIIVYRGVYNMNKDDDNIYHPIPFSTCLDQDYSYQWIEEYPNSFIMKIKVSQENLYTLINNEKEGNEIILSAGYLKKINSFCHNYKNKNVVEYEFKGIDSFNKLIF